MSATLRLQVVLLLHGRVDREHGDSCVSVRGAVCEVRDDGFILLQRIEWARSWVNEARGSRDTSLQSILRCARFCCAERLSQIFQHCRADCQASASAEMSRQVGNPRGLSTGFMFTRRHQPASMPTGIRANSPRSQASRVFGRHSRLRSISPTP